jgi:hypothetical protein
MMEASLEKSGAPTHLTVELYDRDERLIFGPAHPTSRFDLLAPVAAGSNTKEEGEFVGLPSRGALDRNALTLHVSSEVCP